MSESSARARFGRAEARPSRYLCTGLEEREWTWVR